MRTPDKKNTPFVDRHHVKTNVEAFGAVRQHQQNGKKLGDDEPDRIALHYDAARPPSNNQMHLWKSQG